MFYILRIAGQYLLALGAALGVNFILPRLAPGNPLNAVLGNDVVETMTPEQIAITKAQLGLDGTLFTQFIRYLDGILHGDFGTSVVLGMPVWDALVQRLPWTLAIMSVALILSTLIGTIGGIWAARANGGGRDVAVMGSVLFLGSLPPFWVAMMLIIVFSTTLGWLPAFGAYQLGTRFPDWAWLLGVIKRMILPVTALVIYQMAAVLLIARSAMQITQDQDYILFARARGVSERRIFYRHALRNAALPIYTHIMLGLGALVSGALVIETVFAYPGLGSLIVMGVNSRDYLLLQGLFIFTSVSVIFANFITDLAYPLIDPRMRRKS